jgi:hypothetical protein
MPNDGLPTLNFNYNYPVPRFISPGAPEEIRTSAMGITADEGSGNETAAMVEHQTLPAR